MCGGVGLRVHVYPTPVSTCLIGVDRLVLTCTGVMTKAAGLWEELGGPGRLRGGSVETRGNPEKHRIADRDHVKRAARKLS